MKTLNHRATVSLLRSDLVARRPLRDCRSIATTTLHLGEPVGPSQGSRRLLSDSVAFSERHRRSTFALSKRLGPLGRATPPTPKPEVTLKAKDIGRLPEYAVSTAQETLQSLQTIEAACKALIKKPALTDLTMSDANDLVRLSHTYISSVQTQRLVARTGQVA